MTREQIYKWLEQFTEDEKKKILQFIMFIQDQREGSPKKILQ